jgi:hypothetical protein
MRIYLAGEPGGNLNIREREILSKFSNIKRLQSFYYLEQLKILLEVICEDSSAKKKLDQKKN